MQIVKYVNPVTKKNERCVCFSDEEKAAINLIVSVLGEIEQHVFEGRDVYEFRFAQKFLKMVAEMTSLNDVTDEIDRIIMSECEGSEFQSEDIGEISNLIDMIGSITEIIDNAGKSIEDDKKKKKENKQKPKRQEKREEYEQLKIDIAEEEKR